MTFKDIRRASGMNMTQFHQYFRIPYRTVQNWEAGLRQCPQYLLDLMKYKLDHKEAHGQWIYHECVSSYDGAKSGYSCSVCSGFVDENIFDMDEFNKRFCGNCGAKMDK